MFSTGLFAASCPGNPERPIARNIQCVSMNIYMPFSPTQDGSISFCYDFLFQIAFQHKVRALSLMGSMWQWEPLMAPVWRNTGKQTLGDWRGDYENQAEMDNSDSSGMLWDFIWPERREIENDHMLATLLCVCQMTGHCPLPKNIKMTWRQREIKKKI